MNSLVQQSANFPPSIPIALMASRSPAGAEERRFDAVAYSVEIRSMMYIYIYIYIPISINV